MFLHSLRKLVHLEGVLLPSSLCFLACIQDRKSTRLNSSHSQISYAVFCLKKKKYTVSAIPQPPRYGSGGSGPFPVAARRGGPHLRPEFRHRLRRRPGRLVDQTGAILPTRHPAT